MTKIEEITKTWEHYLNKNLKNTNPSEVTTKWINSKDMRIQKNTNPSEVTNNSKYSKVMDILKNTIHLNEVTTIAKK